jgi:hypothetical protein
MIRTCDLFLPREADFQAFLHPDVFEERGARGLTEHPFSTRALARAPWRLIVVSNNAFALFGRAL